MTHHLPFERACCIVTLTLLLLAGLLWQPAGTFSAGNHERTRRRIGSAMAGTAPPGSAQCSGSNFLSSGDAAFQWNATGSLTVALWWFSGTLPSASQNEWILSQTASPVTTSGFGLRLSGSTGNLNCEFSGNVGGGQNPYRAVPVQTIVANRWYVIQAALFSGTTQVACEVADATNNTDAFNQVAWTTPGTVSTSLFELGSGPSGTDGGGLTCTNTSGRIDNVGVWSRPLSGAEWTALKNVVGGVPQGLDWAAVQQTTMADAVAYWQLDRRGGGVSLVDQTGHNHVLTNTGGVTSGSERGT